MAKKSTRIRPIEALRPFKSRRIAPGLPADVATSRKRLPDFIPAEISGRKIMPEVAIDKPCTRKQKTTLRPCHVELTFVGDRLAQAGVAAGAYVRLCSTFGGKGTLVPVADHRAADRVAKAFCECRKTASASSCAKKVK